MSERYILSENGKVLHQSYYISKLINYTAETTNAIITYNGAVVWAQRPENYLAEV